MNSCLIRKSFTSSLLKSISFNKVTTKIDNKIGYIYLESDKDFNALSVEMKSSMSKSSKEFETSPDVKVTVLLSNVKKAFCAGANIK